MNNVGYAAGSGLGHGVNAAGAVAGGAVRGVKNIGKALGKTASSAIDALGGNYKQGSGSDIVKTATGTLLPQQGDQVYAKDDYGFKRIYSVSATDEKTLKVELTPVRSLGDKRSPARSKVISLQDYDSLPKVEKKK